VRFPAAEGTFIHYMSLRMVLFLFLYFYQNSVKTEFYDKPRKTVQETSSINSAVSIDVTGTEPWHIYRALCICIMRCIFVAR